jgi:hypothetical protein
MFGSRPLSEDSQDILTHYDLSHRIIYFDVPEIDMDYLYGFCRRYKVFGKDRNSTYKFVQFYIIRDFMTAMSEMFEINGPLNFREFEKERAGFKLKSKNRGMSATLLKEGWDSKIGSHLQQICDLDNAFRIVSKSKRNILTSYGGLLKKWHLAHTKQVLNKMKNRGYRIRDIHRNTVREGMTQSELGRSDKFLSLRNALYFAFPDADEYNIIYAYDKEDFEKELGRESPVIWSLMKNDFIYMLLHTLKRSETHEIMDALHARYERTKLKRESKVSKDPLAYLTVRERIQTVGKTNILGSIKHHLIPLLDEFELQIDSLMGYLESDDYEGNEKWQEFVEIMGMVPRDYKQQLFKDRKAFLVENFLGPIKTITNVINNRVKTGQNTRAKEAILQLPFSKVNPFEIVNENAFAYLFPHIYLVRLKDHLLNFPSGSDQDLEKHMTEFIKKIEEKPGDLDIYRNMERLPGSFETGKRR